MVSRNVSSNKPSAAAIEWEVHYLLGVMPPYSIVHVNYVPYLGGRW